MKFSLITVTMGDRPDILRRLTDSLARQTCRDFEHIVIDQREHPKLKGGLSRARNLGLDLAKGDIVAFPDDDAWYASETLARVAAALQDGKADGVSFRVTDETGTCSAGGYMSPAKMAMTRSSIWRTAVSCSFFVRRAAVGSQRFDPELGVGSGTRFGSGEETDFILRLMEAGASFVYDGTFSVYHPQPHRTPRTHTGWLYGNGCGRVLRRHGYSPVRMLWMVSLQLVRAAQALARLRFRKMSFHVAMATGRLCGYCNDR